MIDNSRDKTMLSRAAHFTGLLLSVSILAAGCGGDDESGGATAGAAGSDQEQRKIGMALVVPRNDDSFGEENYRGLQEAAKEFDLDTSIVDNLQDPEEQRRAVENLARDNDLVIAGGTDLAPAVNAAVPRFPDTDFVLTDGVLEPAENAHWTIQDWAPLGYLAGAAATAVTESDKIGFVGGGRIPPTAQGEAGFREAAKAEGVEVLATVTGSWTDAARAKQAAAAQISAGADVIYSFVDAAHAGVIEAITDSGEDVKVIGVIARKCDISAGKDIGDTVHGIEAQITTIVEDWVNDRLENHVYGIEDPEVGDFVACPQGEKEYPEMMPAVKKARDGILEGQIEVPELQLPDPAQ